jgi:hypothetical protein
MKYQYKSITSTHFKQFNSGIFLVKNLLQTGVKKIHLHFSKNTIEKPSNYHSPVAFNHP